MSDNKIPTFEEFKKNILKDFSIATPSDVDNNKIAIEFAKLHVKAALKAAAADISEGSSDAMEACIIESYPLENIK